MERRNKPVAKSQRQRALLSYEKKKSMIGYLFLIPWAIGTLVFLLFPLFQSVLYSFGNLRIGKDYGIDLVGLTHYMKAFTQDSRFLPLLSSSLPPLLYQVPIIVLLSLFLALLLNRKFFGRTVIRGIFFLPIIIANGMILSILNGDAFSASVMSGSSSSHLFNSEMLGVFLTGVQGAEDLVGFVTGFVDSIFSLLWKSGIQTLLFITALQSIPISMYEAAKMEGGTSWEIFWKITFPMVSPTILLNVVYTIIDTFGDPGNEVMKYANSFAQQGDFNYSSALIWIYTIIILAFVGLTYFIIDRFVYYEV